MFSFCSPLITPEKLPLFVKEGRRYKTSPKWPFRGKVMKVYKTVKYAEKGREVVKRVDGKCLKGEKYFKNWFVKWYIKNMTISLNFGKMLLHWIYQSNVIYIQYQTSHTTWNSFIVKTFCELADGLFECVWPSCGVGA